MAAALTALVSLALAFTTPAQARAQGPARVQGPAPARAQTAGPRPCTPSITVLASLPGASAGAVTDLGRGRTAVGSSAGKPVYWRGTRVHAVPLPAGYTGGTVEAVNRHGLMVGTLSGPGRGPAPFSYRPGARAVTLLPGGGYAKDVDDRGRIVGYRHEADGRVTGVEWWGRTIRGELAVPAHVRVEEVTGINNAGQIVGSGYGEGEEYAGYHVALLWSADRSAPARELPPVHPGDTYSSYAPRDIDDRGRMAGTFSYSRAMESAGLHWAPPYTEEPLWLAPPGGRTSATLEDISPSSGVAVGTVGDSPITGPWPPDTAPPEQAQYWPGAGSALVLPRLAPEGASAAYAVGDDDRVGGRATDASGRVRPVIWTCASRQAYQP
ncbi:hypothetical protein J7E93_03170 [Streptomyces sp. ISL-36]|uniref:hypothetical protein n=1 Tax=Streptomyces sp. ISL-36 TaxID=2819182 RepID=UPI001BEA9960|nr:hypothetical protein [Streptomyces sp. ISL-36]MBT2439137.1 hypothetical protein [Streptomyces sp. ISL-36]